MASAMSASKCGLACTEDVVTRYVDEPSHFGTDPAGQWSGFTMHRWLQGCRFRKLRRLTALSGGWTGAADVRRPGRRCEVNGF
mmetsp:Transcript_69533/g.137578  ORF Transcript_69533/g.137578 Transcript_69533/m.137578 type:complete len:83 (+) Transcript_69533:1-249(+)